jgi:threonine dehydratase
MAIIVAADRGNGAAPSGRSPTTPPTSLANRRADGRSHGAGCTLRAGGERYRAIVQHAVVAGDVLAAAARIAGGVTRTPLARSRTLSAITGADVHVKFENLQFTASYKERGALNRLLTLLEERGDVPGVVAASAGNFAQGVAHHAARLSIPAVIVMPTATPMAKSSRTAILGADVVTCGDTFEAANAAAARLAAERGFVLLSPFDDPAVIAGQGTVALELLDDAPDLDTWIVPAGGGGLLAGMAVAARTTAAAGTTPPSGPRAVQLVGVQSEAFPGLYNRFHRTELPVGGRTIAEGIAVAEPGDITSGLINELVDRVEIVSEPLLEQAVGLYLEIEKTVAEGAGAAPLAELLTRPERYRDHRVALVLSGGNIDLRQLASVTMRSLVRSGRLTRLWVQLDDRPGAIGALSTTIGDAGANIVEVVHRRLDPAVHARSTDVELMVETIDRPHFERVRAALATAGYEVTVAE